MHAQMSQTQHYNTPHTVVPFVLEEDVMFVAAASDVDLAIEVGVAVVAVVVVAD